MIEQVYLGNGLDDPNGDNAYTAFSKMNRNMVFMDGQVTDFLTKAEDILDGVVATAANELVSVNKIEIDKLKTNITNEVQATLFEVSNATANVEESVTAFRLELTNSISSSEQRVAILEQSAVALIDSVTVDLNTKLESVQSQFDDQYTEFNEKMSEILAGSISDSAHKLTNPVNIQGVSFDGSEDISLPTFSLINDGLVPKVVEENLGTFLRSDGTWVNPTEALIDTLGNPNGIATLDEAGKILSSQLPSYVDDVLEFSDVASFPIPGESGKIYVETEGNTTYRWGGSAYVKIASGEVDSVAGKKGVVTLVKSDVGLSNVDNTADKDKSVKHANTAQALASAVKIQDILFDGTSSIELPLFGSDINGLVPKKVGDTNTKFLREDGSWVIPTNTTYTSMPALELTTGTEVIARTISAKTLNDELVKYANLSKSNTFAGDVNVTGAIVATGNITAFSDVRVKTNISPIMEATDKLNLLNGVTFTRSDLEDKERKYVGLIAQDVLNALPEAVFEQEGKLSVDYMGLVGLLVASIKELNKRIHLLEESI